MSSQGPIAGRPLYDERAALVVVDVQNDFADVRGSLAVRDADEVVARANDEIRAAVAAGSLVVYTRDWHPARTPHFVTDGGVWPVHCVRDSWGAEFHPDLLVDGIEIRKAQGPEDGYSGFSVQHLPTGERRGTGLDDRLRARGIDSIVVIGLATDYCVKETALDGRRAGFAVTVLRRAVAPVDLQPGDGERAIEQLQAAGVAVV